MSEVIPEVRKDTHLQVGKDRNQFKVRYTPQVEPGLDLDDLSVSPFGKISVAYAMSSGNC
jgi:hypothetical protein